MDFYTVNVSSTDGQRLCRSQTPEGNATSVVLEVTGCAICQGSNKSYTITVEASNHGGQTTATTSLSKVVSTMYHCNIIYCWAIFEKLLVKGLTFQNCYFIYISQTVVHILVIL